MFTAKVKRITGYRWLNLSRRAKRRHINHRAKSEMIQVQKTDKIVFSKAAFRRLCKEISEQYKFDIRFTKEATHGLAEMAQTMLTHLFEDSLAAAEHAGRKTVMPKDMKYVCRQWAKHDNRIQSAH